jgi:hypothetical protein
VAETGVDAAEHLSDFTTTSDVLWMSALSIGLGAISAVLAKWLLALIARCTNIFFLQRVSTGRSAPDRDGLPVAPRRHEGCDSLR